MPVSDNAGRKSHENRAEIVSIDFSHQGVQVRGNARPGPAGSSSGVPCPECSLTQMSGQRSSYAEERGPLGRPRMGACAIRLVRHGPGPVTGRGQLLVVDVPTGPGRGLVGCCQRRSAAQVGVQRRGAGLTAVSPRGPLTVVDTDVRFWLLCAWSGWAAPLTCVERTAFGLDRLRTDAR